MKQRVIASLVLAPVVLGSAMAVTPYPLFAIAAATLLIGFWELRQLLQCPKAIPAVTLAAFALPFWASEQASRSTIQLALWCVPFFFVGSAFALAGAGRYAGSPATTDLAGMWIASPLSCILMLHKLASGAGYFGPVSGMLQRTAGSQLLFEPRTVLLLVFIPVWLGDTAGLFAGKKWGRKLLWQKVSPQKTVVGSVANLVVSVVSALLLSIWIQRPPAFSKPLLCYLCCGIIAGVFGQVGDLLESYLKRSRGVKDSGTVIPGHGGVLDRIDSLLFSAPLIILALLLWPI